MEERHVKMKSLIFILTTSYVFLLSDSRLLVTEKTTVKIPATTLLTRVIRSVFEDGSEGLCSKDESSIFSGEVFSARNEKKVHAKPSRYALKRITRNSVETAGKTMDNISTIPKVTSSKSILVKKPIPKFQEIDYEENFQERLTKSQNKYNTDSGEHEDEDFNVDDYDFDVNHDEFASRGKPLEPRVKNKPWLEQQHLDDMPSAQKKIIKAKKQQPSKTVSKRHQIAVNTKKVADKMKEDYSEDYSTLMKKSLQKKHESEDLNNDSGASKELKFINLQSSETTQFKAFVNWINQTSGLNYKVNTIDQGALCVIKLPETGQTTSFKPHFEESYVTPGKNEYVESYAPSVSSDNTETETPRPVEIDSKIVTSESRSIMNQLENGVIVPHRRAGKPNKKVSVKSLGFSRSELMCIINDNPKATMAELIRILYRKKGNWSLFNNTYDVTKIYKTDN